jgi:hypothetical protein
MGMATTSCGCFYFYFYNAPHSARIALFTETEVIYQLLGEGLSAMAVAFDTLRSMPKPVIRRMTSALTQAPVNASRQASVTIPDRFQKGLQQTGHPQVGQPPNRPPTVIRGAINPSAHPERHQDLLKKPASPGGLNRPVQAPESSGKVTPASEQHTRALAQMTSEAAKKNVASRSDHNPFKSALLSQNMSAAGLKKHGMTTPATPSPQRKTGPQFAGAAATAMSAGSISLLSSFVAGPAALVMKPALMNTLVSKLHTVVAKIPSVSKLLGIVP